MAEVSIKAHTRRGKNGKTVQVRGYTRRVGRKGIHSPKREKSRQPGEEFEKKMEDKQPKMSPEEIAAKIKQRKEWEELFKRAEDERKSLGMSRERYSWYKMKEQKEGKPSPKRKTSEKPVEKVSSGVLSRVEDRIARFVEKYSKKKYKRLL